MDWFRYGEVPQPQEEGAAKHQRLRATMLQEATRRCVIDPAELMNASLPSSLLETWAGVSLAFAEPPERTCNGNDVTE